MAKYCQQQTKPGRKSGEVSCGYSCFRHNLPPLYTMVQSLVAKYTQAQTGRNSGAVEFPL